MSTESRALRTPLAATAVAVEPWIGLAALFLFVSIIESVGIGHLFAFLPLRLRELGVLQADVPRLTGICCGAMFVLGLPLVPLWGVWADRHGRKPVIARSAWVQAIVFAGIALGHTPLQLGTAMLLAGLQLGNTGVMLAALRQVAPKDRVGLALSLVNLGTPIGTALGPALGGKMMDAYGLTLSQLFFIDAALALLAGIVLTVAYHEKHTLVPAEGNAYKQALASIKQISREPVARMLLFLLSLFLVGRNMVNPFIALLVERLHEGPAGLASAVGMVVGTASLVGALVSPAAAAAGDRFGHRRVLAVALAMGGAALAGMAFAPSVASLAVATALFSSAFATVVALVYALLALDVPDRMRSVALNLAFVPFYVGALLGPNLAAVAMSRALDPWLDPLGIHRLARVFPLAILLVGAALFFSRRLPRRDGA